MIRLLLVDDHPLVSEGSAACSRPTRTSRWSARPPAAPEGVTAARTLRPDPALMDLRMPDGDGVGATREIVAAGLSGSWS